MIRHLAWVCAAMTFLGCVGLSSQPLPKTENNYPSAAHAPQETAQQQHPKSRWENIWDRTLEDPIAFYTFVLAVFTGVLSVVSITQIVFLIRADKTTRIAANAARAAAEASSVQAKAIVNVERPFVYVSGFDLNQLQTYRTEGGQTTTVYKITVTYTNYGRTPAFVTRIGCGDTIGDEPPSVPSYHVYDDTDIVIEPGRSFEFNPMNIFEINSEQRKAIDANTAFPWLWGKIRYRDFFNGIAEVGWVAFQYPAVEIMPGRLQGAAFRVRRIDGYTYERYQEDDSSPSPTS